MRRWVRQVGRILGAAACAASVLAFAALAFGWLRSYWFADVFDRIVDTQTASGLDSSDRVEVLSVRGFVVVSSVRRHEQLAGPRLTFNRTTGESELESWPRTPFRFTTFRHSTIEPDRVNLLHKTWSQRLGFNVRHSERSSTSRDGSVETTSDWTVRVPHWALLLLATVPPVAFFGLIKRAVRRGRLRRGQCAACGYDLRATPDRCPECGAPADAPITA